MIFHVELPQVSQTGSAVQRTWEFSTRRAALAVGLGILLFLLAFLAFEAGWSDGSTSLLHLAETAFGGIIGAMVGEHAAVATMRPTAR